MKLKVVLTTLVLLAFVVITHVCAYNTGTDTFRTSHFTHAQAWGNNSGLSNGTYNTYASVNYGSTRAGNFDSQYVSASVSDMGALSQSATANAYFGGYDSSGQY